MLSVSFIHFLVILIVIANHNPTLHMMINLFLVVVILDLTNSFIIMDHPFLYRNLRGKSNAFTIVRGSVGLQMPQHPNSNVLLYNILICIEKVGNKRLKVVELSLTCVCSCTFQMMDSTNIPLEIRSLLLEGAPSPPPWPRCWAWKLNMWTVLVCSRNNFGVANG